MAQRSTIEKIIAQSRARAGQVDKVISEAARLSPESQRIFKETIERMSRAEWFGGNGEVEALRNEAIQAPANGPRLKNLIRMTHILGREGLLALNDRFEAGKLQATGVGRG